jgi:outer membrane immunogenic protein
MNVRRLLLAATLLSAAVSTSALAADMPTKVMSPIPASMWTGFYVGLNAGYGWASVGDTTTSNTLKGFVGGGQLGYNWQTGALVLGLEGDFQGSTQKRTDTVVLAGTTFTVDQKLPWLATARGRIGYAPGNWMLYATGGAAWVNYKLSVSAGGVTVSDDTSKAAWTAGAGVEWMFMPKWSFKLEYLYVDTGNTNVTLLGTTFTARAKDNIVRAGVNYHF